MSKIDLPSPPFVEVDGIANFRDIGGQDAARDGAHVRRGLVFRAADPSKVTESGLKTMSDDLGIKAVFDLRSLPELKRQGPEWADDEAIQHHPFKDHGIRREWVPVFANADYSPEQIAVRYKAYTKDGNDGFVQAYRDILAAAPQAYTAVFRHLIKQNPEPCLIHCTAGKDRTGVLTALLLQLAGVKHDVIADEYALTDLGLDHLKPFFRERLLKHPALEGNVEGVNNMTSSKKANMLGTLTMLDKEYGGAEGYLKNQCKLSDQEISTLKQHLTEQSKD